MHQKRRVRVKGRVMRCVLAICMLLIPMIQVKVQAQEAKAIFFPEQCRLQLRSPVEFCSAAIPDSIRPPTVAEPPTTDGRPLSLEEAIAIAVQNSQVVRMLAGEMAVSSGRTIYDAAIVNTTIDENRAKFDPTVEVNNRFDRTEVPNGQISNIGIQNVGLQSDGYALSTRVAKQTRSGGTAAFRLGVDRFRFDPAIFPLNPLTTSATEFSYIQPLLQGAGWRANRVPIVVARMQTEQSFFQLKDAMQRMVADLVDVYWSLVVARLGREVRHRQIQYATEVFEQAQARVEVEESDARDATQSAMTLALLEAELVATESDVIQQEAALRNIMGLPPAGQFDTFIPVTTPVTEQLSFDWQETVVLAEQFRPDIVELKLVLEADQQLRIQANNQAMPRLDAVALYRWNGLDGTTLTGGNFRTDPEQFQDWSLGVNFSVPLALRRERATLRRHDLLISRDRENLKQSIHAASHLVAQSMRKQAQYQRQYERFRIARLAAENNLQLLESRIESGLDDRTDILLRLLQTIQDWGTAVQGEATSLGSYNSELSRLELETGTILESHSIRFVEEQRAFIGPLGRKGPERCFVARSRPVSDQVTSMTEAGRPAEEFFRLDQRADSDETDRNNERDDNLEANQPSEDRANTLEPRLTRLPSTDDDLPEYPTSIPSALEPPAPIDNLNRLP